MAEIEKMFELDNNTIVKLNTDEQLKEFMRNKPTVGFGKAMEGLKKGNVRKLLGDVVPDKLDNTMHRFVEINMKYRFYLYKYLQLNAFIPNFAQAVTSIHSDMYTSLLALTIYLHEKHKEVVQNIISVMEKAATSSDFKGVDEVEKLMKDLNIKVNGDLAATFKNVIEKSRIVERQTMGELIKWIVDEQEKMSSVL
jgi:hypothetical protein